MERQELLDKLKLIQAQEKELRLQLNELDREQRINTLKTYLQKCYIHKIDKKDNFIRAIYVYKVNEERQSLDSLEIMFYPNLNEHYHIYYTSNFDLTTWTDEIDDWEEMPFSEFLDYYNQVQQKVSIAFNNTVNIL